MLYLTYDEYTEIGGVFDEIAFNRNIDRACLMIDLRTNNRLFEVVTLPQIVKIVCTDLIDYIGTNTIEKSIASRSQSAGGVSESESYVIKTAEDYAKDLDRIFEPLGAVFLNGVSLLYKGAMS